MPTPVLVPAILLFQTAAQIVLHLGLRLYKLDARLSISPTATGSRADCDLAAAEFPLFGTPTPTTY